MGTRINTNLAALNAAMNLNNTQSRVAKSVERLSSGLRINKSSDDAAGMLLSQTLRADLRSLEQAIRNANDGFNVLGIIDGASGEIHDILIRMRQLAQQSANGVLGTDSRLTVQAEFSLLQSEITRIASTITFNGLRLGVGGTTTSAGVYMASSALTVSTAATSMNLQVGIRNDVADRIGVDISLGNITSAGNDPGGSRRLGLTAVGLRIYHVGEGGGTFNGVTYGNGVATFTNNPASGNFIGGMNGATLNAAGVAVSSVSAARSSLTAIDYAIRSLSLYRARIGSSANRLERTISNSEVTVRNVSASESFIRDTDFAHETANLVRSQVLAQAGAAALAQANLIPQSVLTLLG
ncbi:MAG: hypothetical protein HYT87_06615 [Nitrospirae bacterium]|nr:hypothetical protein [Nitrospirota bacterium]